MNASSPSPIWSKSSPFSSCSIFFSYSVSDRKSRKDQTFLQYRFGFCCQLSLAGYRTFLLTGTLQKLFSCFLYRMKCQVEFYRGILLGVGFYSYYGHYLSFLCATFTLFSSFCPLFHSLLLFAV